MDLTEVVNLHRLTMALGASEDKVKQALEDAVTSASAGARIAASRLLSGRLRPGAEAVVLYCVDGLSDTKAVSVLVDGAAARAAHDAVVESGSAVRYAVCYRATPNDGAPPHLASRHSFAPAPAPPSSPEQQQQASGASASSSATAEDDGSGSTGDAATVTNSPSGGALSVVTFDVHPSALSVPSRRLADVVHRRTAAVANAEGTVDLIQRGVPGADIDGAAAGLCAWIVETLASVDVEYDRAVEEAFAGLRASTADVKAAAPTLALGVVEALLQRHGALQALYAALTVPGSVAEVLSTTGCTADYTGTAAQGALRQRITGVHVAARASRRDAWCLVPLLKPLMALKLWDAAAAQSVVPIAADVAEHCAVALLVATSTAPRPAGLLHSGFFLSTLLPLLNADMTAQVTALLALDGGVFLPKELGRSTSLDVPAVDSELAPTALSAPAQSAMEDAWWTLARWTSAVTAAATVSALPDFTLMRSALADVDVTARAVSGASYACDRIRALQRMLREIKAEGCGLLPPPLMCQFATIHQAAQAFPLLSAHQFLNWKHFEDTVMARTRVLKYTEVDPHRRYAEHVAPVTTPPLLQPGHAAAATTTTTTNGEPRNSPAKDPVMEAAVDEERSLLRSRVVLLTTELNDCRSLLTAMSHRVDVAEQAAAAAHAEMEALKQELTRLRLAQQQQQQEQTAESKPSAASPAAAPADASPDSKTTAAAASPEKQKADEPAPGAEKAVTPTKKQEASSASPQPHGDGTAAAATPAAA